MIPSIEPTPQELQEQKLTPENLAQAVKHFTSKGCLQLTNVFPVEFIRALRETYLQRYERYFREGQFGEAKEVGHQRIQISVDFSAPFNDPQLYANPLILPILQSLLEKTLYFGIFGTVTSLPGSQLQHLHRDNPLLFGGQINRFIPPYAINLFVPLVDFNERTGTTRLFPTTHVKTEQESKVSPGFDPVVPVGSCLLADYRIYHQGTANVSDVIRPLLFCAYHRPWFKDYVNHKSWPFLRISDAEYARIPAEHRPMFSWVEHYRGGLY